MLNRSIKYLLVLMIMTAGLQPVLSHPQKKVNLQLRWFHQYQFAGYYAAKKLGYYEEAGLDVNIIEGGIDTDVMKEVVSGSAHFGVQTPSIVLDRAKGEPVVALAAIFQHSPVALIVNKESGIETPSMLAGKRIMLGRKNVEIRAMLISESVIDKVEVLEFTGNYKDLINGKVDGASGYVTDVSYLDEQTGNTFGYIRPVTYGIDFYGDCLFTSEDLIHNESETVAAFREASLKGWRFAMDNPGKMIDIIISDYKNSLSREKLLYEYNQLLNLMHTDLVEIGHMNPGRWKHIVETFQRLGQIDPDFRIKGFLYSDHIDPDHNTIKAVLSILSAVLFILLAVLWRNYRKEKLKEALEEAKHKQELKESEARFRGLIEFGADGILLGSHEGFIIEVNEMACSIIGMNRNDLIGKYVTAIPFTEESLQRAPLRFDLLKEGKIVINERDLIRPDGTFVNIEMKTKMMADGTYQSIFRDLTEKKTAEKEIEFLKSRFEYVLGATKTGFDIIDEDNNVIYVDPNWAERLGGYSGKKCYEYFMGTDRPCTNCAIPEALETGKTTISEEYLEKESRYVEVHTISLNEKIRGKRIVAEFNIDITERKNIEKRLRQFNAELENMVAERTSQLANTNKELESFSYSVSHDLRAPVRHIIGFTDIFMKENEDMLNERSRDTFSKIIQSAHRMERLIDDLLQLSRTGRQELIPKHISMNKIVENVIAEYKNCKGSRTVETQIGQLPQVFADQHLLTTVWENLVDNACKYTKGRTVTKISVRCTEEKEEYVFSIKDNGVGFDPEFKNKLFGVFQRLHLSKDFPGTGVGLANVRRIISRHGGRTWAESEGEDKGAEFFFTLPIYKGGTK